MGMQIATALLTVANAVVWGFPASIYSWLWLSKIGEAPPIRSDEWPVFLLLIATGPIQYFVGFVFSVFRPLVLWRAGNIRSALTVAGIFLVLGLLDAAWGILMLGST
jgi:hypothetical protein